MRKVFISILFLAFWSQPLLAQEAAPVTSFSANLGAWGIASGAGLIGVGAQVDYQQVGLEGFLGIGTNRFQGWALWPRMYMKGITGSADDLWQPFGELPMVQVSETEINIDPDVGLVKNTFTWHYIGVGLGVQYRQDAQSLSLSAGLGVTGGQCLPCRMEPYLAIRIGFAF